MPPQWVFLELGLNYVQGEILKYSGKFWVVYFLFAVFTRSKA